MTIRRSIPKFSFKEPQGLVPRLTEEDSLVGHVILHTKLINARNGEHLRFSDLTGNANDKLFPDYKKVDYVHCVLLRHFA